MEFDLIITNGVLATASDLAPLDIFIKSGKIALLAPPNTFASTAKATRAIDARGAYITPGGVDTHVHLEEPPLFGGRGRSCDTFESGTRSAICGGTTTIVAFAPQAKNMPSLLEVLRDCHGRAAGNCYADYGFHMLVGHPSEAVLGEFSKLIEEEGVSSLKIYMTYEALQLRDDQILDVLFEARRNSITTMVHAENGDVLNWMTRKLEEKGFVEPVYHAASRPQIVEQEATGRAIKLAELIDAPILIVHVSSPVAAREIRDAQSKGLPVYAETCPQYLFLTRADMAKSGDHGFEGAKCVCSPPPRDGVEDHEGIWLGLRNGTFTVLSSDHCPFMYEDREKGKKSILSEEFPKGRFKGIPNGIPGIETRLPLVLSEGKMRIEKFVEVTSTNPAKLYGLYPKKGAVLPGVSDADLVIWYPEGEIDEKLTNSMLHHNVDYTPFEGRQIRNWPRYTILRGEVVFDRDGEGLVGRKGYGEFVKRGKSSLPGPVRPGDFDISSF
jgi:dihydropyrimidinase